MADEPADAQLSQQAVEQASGPKRVRRRRSAKRAGPVQSRLPFTSLRFARPRGPTPGQAAVLACTVAALGLSAWAIKATGEANLALAQARAQLAVNTRGDMAGQLAADRLESQAHAEAAQMMARRDAMQAQAGQVEPGLAASGAYLRSERDDDRTTPTGGAPLSSGVVSAPLPTYGASAFAPPSSSPATAPTDGNAMGYTLPSSGPPR